MASGVDAVVWRRPLTDGERIQGWGWGWGDVGEAARWRCLSLGCTSCDRAHQFPCPPPRVLAHLHMGFGRGQVIAHLQRVFAPLLTTSIAALSTTGRDDKHTQVSPTPTTAPDSISLHHGRTDSQTRAPLSPRTNTKRRLHQRSRWRPSSRGKSESLVQRRTTYNLPVWQQATKMKNLPTSSSPCSPLFTPTLTKRHC